jgi:hypothetical protein
VIFLIIANAGRYAYENNKKVRDLNSSFAGRFQEMTIPLYIMLTERGVYCQ